MKVILLQDVKGHGKKGDLIDASDGFARNYLLPKKLAIAASPSAINEMKSQNEAKMHRLAQEKAAAQASAEKLNGQTVRIKASAGASGKLYGAVTSQEIADAITAQYGVGIDKHKVVLKENIKACGVYEVKIKLGSEITALMKLSVESESGN
jgi:large subunit ribosomal protein L9